jgi:putative membrane protein
MNKYLWTAVAALPLMASAASPDEGFFNEAAQGGLAEVQLSQSAQNKGQSQAVKDYAAMIIQDHTAANDKLKTLATSKGVDLPTAPGATQMATKAKLDTQAGDAFDKAYIQIMLKDHKDTIKAFEKEAQSGQDPDAKAFASATLPTLHEHLTKIKSIARAAVGAAS